MSHASKISLNKPGCVTAQFVRHSLLDHIATSYFSWNDGIRQDRRDGRF